MGEHVDNRPLYEAAGGHGEEGTPYTREDIMGASERQGVEIRQGDVVLFHSGWLNLIDGDDSDRQRFGAGEPGLGKTGADI